MFMMEKLEPFLGPFIPFKVSPRQLQSKLDLCLSSNLPVQFTQLIMFPEIISAGSRAGSDPAPIKPLQPEH